MRSQQVIEISAGERVKLSKLPTTARDSEWKKDDAIKELKRLREEIAEWQWKLYAEHERALLVVLQGPDAAGKDGTVRHVFRGCNPQGLAVSSFKKPSDMELAHDYLWRIHARLPERGRIGLFNRSHYEDVLVPRVEKWLTRRRLEQRYRQINEFERMLVEEGTTVLKFFLHLSPEEQLERFRARLENPRKRWKYNPDDLKKHRQWPEYEKAYEAMLSRCSTEHAPWYVVPSDQKWYRNLAVAQAVCAKLRRMKPKFPDPEFQIDPASLE